MLRKVLTWVVAAAACAVGCGTAEATNLLINSDFSDYTLNNTAALTNASDAAYGGSFGFGTDNIPTGEPQNVLTGWNTDGFSFIETPGHATTTGADGKFSALALYSQLPGGASNGYTDAPSGHNYIAADAAYNDPHGTLPITQTVNGLTIGTQYALTFQWAGAQQQGYDSNNLSAGWIVSFENPTDSTLNQTFSTSLLTYPNHGFTGWQTAEFIFTATGTTETLSFLAQGTPVGLPPFSLLADPTLQAVPEPATWAMMLIGFGTIGVAIRGRRDKQPTRRNIRPQAI